MGESEGYLPFPKSFRTLCVHHTHTPNKQTCQELLAPIITSNICFTDKHEGLSRYMKGRLMNRTRSMLEKVLCVLYKARYGLCFASGIGAVSAVLGLMKHGDHMISSDDIYGGSCQTICEILPNFGICCSFVDLTDVQSVPNFIKPETKMIYTENPTNPMLKVMDYCALSEIAKEEKLLLVCDNTFLSPFLQRPLDLGVDVVINSLTKYINGHSDVIMGFVGTNDENLFEQLRFIQQHYGHVPSAFECYQVIRAIKTLPLRLMRQHKSSLVVAKWLEKHPKVDKVRHPGLESHPQHKLFKSQTCGHSGMIAVYLKAGMEDTIRTIKRLKVFTHAVSLGGYESLIQQPMLLSHLHVPEELKKRVGITENLLRISVGLEDPRDLIADLEQSLAQLKSL